MNGWLVGEVVHISSSTNTGMPMEFSWRGRRHRVKRVEDYRATTRSHPSVNRKQSSYALRTARGLRCVLSLDERRGIWVMDRVLPGGGGR
jgi:hypothetical protein